MEKLSKQEMKNVKGGQTGNLWSCDYVENPGHFSPVPFCHNGDPTLHTDPTCSDVNTCNNVGSCTSPLPCP